MKLPEKVSVPIKIPGTDLEIAHVNLELEYNLSYDISTGIVMMRVRPSPLQYMAAVSSELLANVSKDVYDALVADVDSVHTGISYKPHSDMYFKITSIVPGLKEDYPGCPWDPCEFREPEMSSFATIAIHLNDKHKMTRDEIVNWLEGAGADLTVKVKEGT